MTTQDYKKFADMFAGEIASAKGYRAQECEIRQDQTRKIILSTADLFAQDNSNFDRPLFYAASGLMPNGDLP
jgi:hypothetical protein